MGAWNFGPFGNDDAADWLCELEASDDASVICFALGVIAGGRYLESSECCNALAAAEIVPALLGRPMMGLPNVAGAWVARHRKLDVSSLVEAALSAVRRIRTDSELKDLWMESDELAGWSTTLDDVTARLSGFLNV